MKILFIVAQEGFRDEELFEPKSICENADIPCDVASITTAPAKGKLGGIVIPNIAVKDVNSDNYDLLVVVGGPGAPKLGEYSEVLNLIRIFAQKKLAAICYAPTVLAKAGVLKGRRVTFFKDKYSDPIIRESGAIISDENICRDGNLVTANGPHAATDFGNALIGLLRM